MTRSVLMGRWWSVGVLLSITLAVGVSVAQTPVPEPPSESNPPGRAARLSVVQGAVSYRPAAGDTWAIAETNRPFTTGDRLWADSVGRAELEIGTTAVRIASETELDFTRLDDHDMQFRLPQGSGYLHIKAFDSGQNYEVDAPNAAVTFGQAGSYRVNVSADGATTVVTTWSGHAEVTAGGQSFAVDAGKAATITGDSTATYTLADAGARDNLDNWAVARDEVADRPSPSAQYVSEDMGGTQDLDNNGSWNQDADYGPVWYPTVVEAGWSPYHTGHWVWEGPWGWTWVDDAPWGWAPYHYGRWAYVHDRWGWCPGPRVYAPVYAPALVGFVGGNGWGVSVGFGAGGGVGWFPLAPREPYYPAYRTDIGYRERINVTNYTNVTQITNVTNVTNITYRNRTVVGAVTAVPRAGFVGGESVSRIAVRVPENELARAPIAGHTAPFAPTARSLAPNVVGPRGRPANVPPARLANRPVVATHAPPPAAVPFAAQQRALAANGGKPLARSELTSLRASSPAAKAPAFPVRAATAPAPNGRGLTPARPEVPAPHPVQSAGFAQRVTTPSFSSTVRQPTSGQPAQAERIPAPAAKTPLDQSFDNQRAQMEVRHQQEFAAPKATERPEQLQQRQETEHVQLDQQYHQAKAAGATAMPARAASPPPAPRAQQAPAEHRKP